MADQWVTKVVCHKQWLWSMYQSLGCMCQAELNISVRQVSHLSNLEGFCVGFLLLLQQITIHLVLKNKTNLYLLVLEAGSLKWTCCQIKVLARRVPSGGSEGEFLVFSSCHLSGSLSLLSFSPTEDPCDYIGPTWMIQSNLPSQGHLISLPP